MNVGPDSALTVEFHKSSAGLGFNLEGGKSLNHGERPLIVISESLSESTR